MTGDGYHLVLVIATPALLALVGAFAALLGGQRWLVWSCVLPAWGIAALSYGLWPLRDEIAGPVLRWCRVDGPGIAVAMVAMPLAAIACIKRTTSAPRFGLQQAAAAGIGLLPIPMLIPWVLFSNSNPWRGRGAMTLVLGATLVAIAVWNGGRVTDACAAVALLLHAALLRAKEMPLGQAQRVLALFLAGVAAARACSLLG